MKGTEMETRLLWLCLSYSFDFGIRHIFLHNYIHIKLKKETPKELKVKEKKMYIKLVTRSYSGKLYEKIYIFGLVAILVVLVVLLFLWF